MCFFMLDVLKALSVLNLKVQKDSTTLSEYFDIFFVVCVEFIVQLQNFSLIWRHHHCW